MKTRSKISLVLLTAATLTASTALAGGYNWKEKVTYGNDPTKRSASTITRTYRTCLAQPQVESRRAYSSYEPAASASFKVGDAIVVTAANADLKIGDRVVATIPQGQHITVSSVDGPWVGTNILQNGQNVGGWILASDLAAGIRSPVACRQIL